MNATALFVVIRVLFGSSLQVGYHYVIAGSDIYLGEVALSIVELAVVGFLYIHAKALLQRLFTALAVLLLLGVVIVAAFCVPRVPMEAMDDFGTAGISKGFAIFTIVIMAPWAFVGFDVASFDTAHYKFPPRHNKWVVAVSIVLAGFVYGILPVVSVAAVPGNYGSWQAYLADLDSLSGVSSVPAFFAASSWMGCQSRDLPVANHGTCPLC